MESNWDFYFCRVDDSLASIYLNLNAGDPQSISSMPYMAYVRVYLNNPRGDGLSSESDFASLSDLEDKIVPILETEFQATYVGRSTSNGCRDFFFYASIDRDWESTASKLLEGAGFDYESGSREDADWSIFREFLYPSARDRQRIENRKTCDVMESNGDNLNSEREIDHWIYFENATQKDTYLSQVRAEGFRIRSEGSPDSEQSRYWIQIFRSDLLSRENIDSICLELFDLAQQHSGEYDGWESPVVTS